MKLLLKQSSRSNPDSTITELISKMWYIEYLFFVIYSFFLYPLSVYYVESIYLSPWDKAKDSLKFNLIFFTAYIVGGGLIYAYFYFNDATK